MGRRLGNLSKVLQLYLLKVGVCSCTLVQETAASRSQKLHVSLRYGVFWINGLIVMGDGTVPRSMSDFDRLSKGHRLEKYVPPGTGEKGYVADVSLDNIKVCIPGVPDRRIYQLKAMFPHVDKRYESLVKDEILETIEKGTCPWHHKDRPVNPKKRKYTRKHANDADILPLLPKQVSPEQIDQMFGSQQNPPGLPALSSRQPDLSETSPSRLHVAPPTQSRLHCPFEGHITLPIPLPQIPTINI